MAPITRSNRKERLEMRQLLASGRASNDTGFPALPSEMHFEILSYFQSMPVPTQNEQVDSRILREQHLTLLSLSQTCRSLRSFYLAYLWQRIEVFNGMETARGCLTTDLLGNGHVVKNKLYTQELLRQLEIVTVRDPSLAKNVNILNVTIVEYSTEAVLRELARCMALFPNLHTVQLNFRIFIDTLLLAERVFGAYQYPQIRTVCLSRSAYSFLSACPRVRNVTSYMNCPDTDFLETVIRECPEVEVLGSPLFLPDTAERLLYHFHLELLDHDFEHRHSISTAKFT
ncbi:hypothetical protein GALMADRAFT_92970 [Galerina marginata CBS 339.88]|uniref:F-box domain-containing protein n=1 Tax=Galerina marginata (strain CBS 339.88) TaxID=685588 RepID=A0A067TGS9_GALM3|nr:hypothetical protein GALMADRAFT_92970 [Galerina marginata CBS 339.88]